MTNECMSRSTKSGLSKDLSGWAGEAFESKKNLIDFKVEGIPESTAEAWSAQHNFTARQSRQSWGIIDGIINDKVLSFDTKNEKKGKF